MESIKLFVTVLFKYVLGLIVVGLLLFLPAGSFDFWNAWLFILVLFIPIFIFFIILFIIDKAFLQKRVKQKETEKTQKIFLGLSTVFYLGIFCIPGLDYRFEWSSVPLWLVIISALMMLLSYMLVCIVLLQNRFASRSIEIQENQKVISTGLYSVVRHPMYLGMILIFMTTPLILGSLWALVPAILYAISLSIRISNEEKVLDAGLPGYNDYKEKVKYRLIPFIW